MMDEERAGNAKCAVSKLPQPDSLTNSIPMDKDVGEGKENGLYSPTEGQGNGNGPEAASALNEDEAPSTKLCGYLHKLGGPLKTWKSRWFTYEEMKCQLYYYRTPQDVTPLGSIELIKATFGYPTQGDEGTFHIQIPERLFVLKALNRETMMYWLQQLQLKRWQHSSSLIRVPAQPSAAPGLDTAQTVLRSTAGNADVFLPTVKTPTGLVGEEAAALPAPWQQLTLQNISLKHPLTELQNSVHNICNSRSFQEYSHSASHAEEPPSEDALSPSIKNTAALPAPPENPPPPAPVQLTEPEQEPHQGGRRSPCSLSWRREKKISTSATLPVDRKEANATARVSRLQQEVFSLQEDLKSQKELVLLLHKALEAAQQEKRTCTQFLSAEGEQERLELVRHRERHIADLEGRLEAQRQEKTELEQRLGQANGHVTELQEHVQLMMEKNHAKQEVILKLSGQVTAFMDDPRRTVCNTMNAETFRQMQEQIDNLKDDIEAYKIQNKFLNSEIYQLTNLWRNSSEQEKGLMMKCAYLEAKNCQIESKYLVVLRKLQESKSLDSQHQDMVKQLIEDALQGDMKDVFKLNPVQEYDEYGFKIIPEYEVGDMKLLAKIQALEIRNHNLLSQDLVDKPLLSRWANYLGGRPSGEPVPSPELKGLIRCGVPREYREQVWRWVVRTRTKGLREQNPQRYQELCRKSETSQHPASRQIQLDLHRTLTSNRRFASPTRPAVQQLRRILMAFSWQNPTIGYCQGLNRLAAIALLVLNSEEDAFWCLVTVVETIMPQDYYNKTLIASQADQRVLKDFMAEKMPRLTAHFEQHNVDVSLITFNWFLVVFVESLASDILLRLWDAFLYEGTKVIFRYALALFKYKEDDILKIHDSVEIYQYLRFFTRTISDGRKLMNIAFNDMNPFPMKLLRNRRFLHREKLRVELRELEKIQEEFVTKTVERKDKELDTVLSDDEEDL
ncbi:TBC1 domain family member 2A isoform X2 [Amia ocellicauda]|uniref:TBC1 domain family member 2A isoform X2 n=1 Tax=Amia ocellicauda TaxID=2972642 RepID=UPI003464CDDA